MTERLETQRAREAELCASLATALISRTDLTDDARAGTMADLRLASQRRDALAQQIAWRTRRTSWVSPSLPAWTD